MLARWFASLADRFFASDHGLIRLRFALRTVFSVTLAVLVLSLVRIPASTLLLGAICAMISSTSLRTGTPHERGLHVLLYVPTMALTLTAATVLAPYHLVSDIVFVAVMFGGVYARKFDQVGAGLGTGGFMAYFFALFLHLPVADLAQMYLAMIVGVGSTALMSLVVFRDTPASTLRRTTLSIRAQIARLIEELARLLDTDQRIEEQDGVPPAVARQATRMHETTLQIEDNADLLDLDPQWQRQLVDAELSADRLARTTVRAIAADLDSDTRAELASDLRGLHRFVDRNPEAALTLDTDELMNRIARYDIRGDAGLLPSKPAHHVLLVHRAIRELLLSVVQIRRTTERVLGEPHRQPADGASRREPTLEDVEQDMLPDSDADTGAESGLESGADAATGGDSGAGDSGAADSGAARTVAVAPSTSGAARPLMHAGPDAHRNDGTPPAAGTPPTAAPAAGGHESGAPSAVAGPDGAGRHAAAEPAAPRRRLGLAYHTRAAIQAAVGGSLAILGGTQLSGARWYWAAIAGFIVFAGTNSRGDLLVKGWRRVMGTMLGIIAGTVLATLLSGHPRVNLVLALLCIFLAFYSLRVSYATMTFFITVMLGMLYDILGEFTPNLLLLRLEETAIGVAGSMVAAMLVLPARTRSTVLTELHDYFTELHAELTAAERLLVDADRVSVIAATREVDRAANDVRTAIAPMLYRLSPSRVRRGHATRLLTLTEESALAARNLARAAEPGALADVPEAVDALHRLNDNIEVLIAATQPGRKPGTKSAKLVSGPALASTVDVRAMVEARDGGEPDRLRVLHLRRTINSLDRLDKLLLGMAAPLAQTISIPLNTSEPRSQPAPGRPAPGDIAQRAPN